MRNKIIKIVIFLIIVIISIIIIVERNLIKKTDDFMFYLEEKYYGTSVFNEITTNELNELIDNGESFAIFIHQPFCSTSYEFNKILTKYADENKVSFYKMSFDEMKKSSLYQNIKYYPSFAIYNNGKLIDYLEADSDEDLNRYKDLEEFKQWFNSYIQIK